MTGVKSFTYLVDKTGIIMGYHDDSPSMLSEIELTKSLDYSEIMSVVTDFTTGKLLHFLSLRSCLSSLIYADLTLPSL